MGHFSFSCKLTGLPITSGTPAALIVMRMNSNLFDNSERKLRKYGTINLLSNEGARVKFTPMWYPIHGVYNDYGGLEDIVKDDHTKVLEEYYGLTIEQIVNIVCSGRKSDGYDSNLSVIKVKPKLPNDYKEGESWFTYYCRTQNDPKPNDKDIGLIHKQYGRFKIWEESNPDPTTLNSNKYKERYKELLSYSGMWVHGEVYEKLTNTKTIMDDNGLDLGLKEVLNHLGFEEIKEGKKNRHDNSERYNRKFVKDALTVNSDGRWISQKDSNYLYDLNDFKKYCASHGVEIDIKEINGKDRTEQIIDYILPHVELKKVEHTVLSEQGEKEFNNILKDIDDVDNISDDIKKRLTETQKYEITEKKIDIKHEEDMSIKHILLNEGHYSINNPLFEYFFEAAKKGMIRNNVVRFSRFEKYMFATGKYYDVVGTSPQDGEHKMVNEVLHVAAEVIKPKIKEIEEWEKKEI